MLLFTFQDKYVFKKQYFFKQFSKFLSDCFFISFTQFVASYSERLCFYLAGKFQIGNTHQKMFKNSRLKFFVAVNFELSDVLNLKTKR